MDLSRNTPFEMLPEWLTVPEFVVVSAIGRTKTYELLRRRELPHKRFGATYLIHKGVLRPELVVAS
jgi:excisionase family DNA binding protein